MSGSLAQRAGAALSWRATALVAGRIINLARYYVLARVLTPADFGLVALAVVPLDVLTSITDVGVQPALVQRRDIGPRHYDVAWTIGLARGLALAAALVAAAPLLATLLAEPRAATVLRVLALRPALGALASIRVVDLERELDFRRLGLIEVGSALAAMVASIALAPLGAWALVWGTLVGATTGAAISHVVAPHRPRLAFDPRVARELLQFGRWVLVGGVVGVVGDAVLRAVISRSLGTAEVGLYFLAAMLASLPNDVVSSLVGGVAFPLHARLQADAARARELFTASLVAMAAVLVPAYAVLVTLAPALVRDALGPRWSGSAPVIQVLAVGGVLGILFDGTAPLLQGRGKPQRVTALFAVLSTTVVALAWVLTARRGLTGAALAWTAAEVAVFATCVVFARQALPAPFGGLLRPMAAIAAASLVAAGTAWVVEAAIPGLLGVCLAAAAAAVAAAAVLWTLDARVDVGLSRAFARAFPRIAERLRGAPRAGERAG